MKSAVAGATTIGSAARASVMWSSACPGSNSSVWTGRPVSASNVIGADELRRRPRQHDIDLRRPPASSSRASHADLVARDSSGDAEKDATAGEWATALGRSRLLLAAAPRDDAILDRRRFDSSSSERVVSFFSRDASGRAETR